MIVNYDIQLSNNRELHIYEALPTKCSISIPKDKLSTGYMGHLAVIDMTKEDIVKLRDCLNKILANESYNFYNV